ncbi:GNAT family N-acetyltransferase [Rathayibacter soli]|uniref:GNAT family N-acetyltransferase n=1 Tax=Rathayibacter soli TaxID=3144168 RepID=UPI0027E5AC94|nr:GNAT family N-acetyltransferase [Glaciibacter superstes]
MAHVVTNETDRNRYVISKEDGEAGFAEYRIDDGTIVFTHTVIDPEKRERGLASELVQFALDDVRATTDLRVVAECPYVKHWLEEHPDYQDLLTR